MKVVAVFQQNSIKIRSRIDLACKIQFADFCSRILISAFMLCEKIIKHFMPYSPLLMLLQPHQLSLFSLIMRFPVSDPLPKLFPRPGMLPPSDTQCSLLADVLKDLSLRCLSFLQSLSQHSLSFIASVTACNYFTTISLLLIICLPQQTISSMKTETISFLFTLIHRVSLESSKLHLYLNHSPNVY